MTYTWSTVAALLADHAAGTRMRVAKGAVPHPVHAGLQSSDGDPGIAQKRPNCRSESTLDNFRSGSDRRLKSFGFSTELVIKTPDPL